MRDVYEGSDTDAILASAVDGKDPVSLPGGTRIRQAEVDETDQREMLRSVLDYMPIPAVVIEPETGRIEFANAAASEAAGGRVPRAAPGEPGADWGAITDNYGQPLPAESFPRARLLRGEPLRHLEMQWHLPGGVHHLLLSGGALPPVGGGRGSIVLMFEDITYLKTIEAELRGANRRKDEFLAMLAHELRNPLMPIRNALAVMTRASSREAAERARAMMDRQVRRMTRLIDDLLDISRISQGKMSLKKGRMDLRQAVRNAAETTQPLFAANRQKIDMALPPRPILLNADLTRVEQIVTNLLTNAAKYTPAGGHIWLALASAGDEAVITVRDDGIGIAPDKLSRIFEMFSQIADAEGRTRSGLGIGLSLVRRLVEMHGGHVAVRSEGEGHGSEFEVRLPRLPEDAEADADEPRIVDGHLKRRVLVVDDNHDVADSLGMMLELMDCDVRTAYDGFDALEAATEFKPHVVFLDVGLPELDGYEVARRLRARPGTAGAALVALSGWGETRHRERAREAGFNHHFVKPPDPAAIEKLLGEIPLVAP
ncbi:MAG TPA: ATP-binding protein [Gammaproteobacteria bacterium]|nr:ATP-binding protein [Gammaproteobacteria bacterium]